jgi:uncharacterized delta-60 repeat protein
MNLYRTISRRFSAFTKLFLLTVIVIANVQAESSSVDLSFNAKPLKESASAGSIPQPDGKIIILGGFLNVNGIAKNQIARLNADGSLDNSFNCEVCDFSFTVSNVALQSSGKIIVAGISSGSFQQPVVLRLNSDGSRDFSFASVFPNNGLISSPYISAIQPDGKILLLIFDSEFYASSCSIPVRQYSILRLNSDGSTDETFSRIYFQSNCSGIQAPSAIRLQPDGKILVGVNNQVEGGGSFVRRYNSDGTSDAAFGDIRFIGQFYSRVYDLAVQANGNIIVTGYFYSLYSTQTDSPGIIRLLPNGVVDTSFVPGITYPVAVKALSNGQILAAKDSRLYRLNASGSVDNTFNPPAGITILQWFVDSAERLWLYGEVQENGGSVYKYMRLNADGSVDFAFNVSIKAAGSVVDLATQTDGKIIAAGDFSQMNGAARRNIARVNPDGSLDQTFDSGNVLDNTVRKVIVQPDGKILVLKEKSFVNNVALPQLYRLNSDGSLAESFNPTTAYIYKIALQPDGKIVIGGNFTSVYGAPRRYVARLNADGSLDESFYPSTAIYSLSSIFIQTDGKILVGGQMNLIGQPNVRGLLRLNSDGSLDDSFNSDIFPAVSQIEVLPDGKFVVVARTVARLNTNGTRDTSFQTQTYGYYDPDISAIFPQSDGNIIVGGSFPAVNNIPRSRLMRLKPNGELDLNFLPNGTNGLVRVIIKQADGKVLVGGDFTSIANVNRVGVARLLISPFRNPTPFDYDGDGKADISVFRPSAGDWYLARSSDGAFMGIHFGADGDLIAPADFDADGKTDICVFRPSTGSWYRLNSSDHSFTAVQFGANGDLPVPGDFDGDRRADVSIYRPSAGSWYRLNSSNGQSIGVQFGISEDKPLVGDFDGDGKADLAVFRPSNGTWYRLNSRDDSFSPNQFGALGDKPVPADYDGDGKTDLAVYRPSVGDWYLINSRDHSLTGIHFGSGEDTPAPADYDGDGKADLAVFRPSSGTWYLLGTTAGFTGLQFGANGDIPTPNAFTR